jgi:hydrogenase/urease accessory protein HupE
MRLPSRRRSFFFKVFSGARRVVGLFLAAWLLESVVQAHDPFASSANARVDRAGIQLEITMGRSAAFALLDDAADLPEEITDEDFGKFDQGLKERGAELFTITAGGAPLVAKEVEVRLTEERDVEFRVLYPPPEASPLRFRAAYLDKMVEDHVGTLYVEDAGGADLGWGYLEAAAPTLEAPLPAALLPSSSSTAPAPAPSTLAPRAPSFSAFLKLGIEHILTGYDHLLFLCGLLVGCRRFATMAGIITCFTLAHSLTLALAALNLVVIPSRVVEPLIAASIVFVGVENLVRRGAEPRGRWAVTFVFGLVHGFGFAGALKAIGMGIRGAALLVPLFSFNLGVELGQIAVAALFLPILFQLRHVPVFVRYGLPAASMVVTILGAYWLLQRTVFA